MLPPTREANLLACDSDSVCESHCLFVDDRWQKKCRKRKRKAPELLIVFTGVGWDDSTGKGLPAAGLKVGIHEPFWTKRPCYEK